MIDHVWLFHCGHVGVPRAALETGADFGIERMPFMGLLAEHAERGPILIDAPFGHEGPANLGRITAGVLERLGLEFRRNWSVVSRIEQIGFRPGDVEHVFSTHLHVDHAGGLKTLGRATFHVARDEWDYATRLSPARARAHGYVPRDYRTLRPRVDEFDMPPTLGDGPALDLLGDGSIRAVGLPGHTMGHVGFRLEMTDGTACLHVGDAAFTIPHITERRGLGFFPTSFAYDVPQARESLRRLRLFHRDQPDVRLLNAHDVALGRACRDRPIEMSP